MSVGLYVRGLVEPTDRFQKMYAAYEACKAAGVQVPDEVVKYFGDEEPDPNGLIVDISAASSCKDNVIEVDLTKLHKDITKIQACLY